MVYVCERCHFEFEGMSEVEQCPDCGKMAIRKATPWEAEAFHKRLKENVWDTSRTEIPADLGIEKNPECS